MADFTTSMQGAFITDSPIVTYSASITGLVVAAAATDFFEIDGSGTKKIRITRITVSGRATAAAAVDISLVKRSTLNSSGTSTTIVGIPHNSSNGAAVAVLKAYTVSPTLGTLVGGTGNALRSQQVFLGNLTTGAPGAAAVWSFSERGASCPMLVSATECFALNYNGATNSGNVVDVDIEWTEALT